VYAALVFLEPIEQPEEQPEQEIQHLLSLPGERRAAAAEWRTTAGLSVNELKVEISVETAMVSAKLPEETPPVMPLMKAHGTNTALSTQPTAITGRTLLPLPL